MSSTFWSLDEEGLEDIEYEPLRFNRQSISNGTVIRLAVTLSCNNTYTLDEVYDMVKQMDFTFSDSRIESLDGCDITCINNVRKGN